MEQSYSVLRVTGQRIAVVHADQGNNSPFETRCLNVPMVNDWQHMKVSAERHPVGFCASCHSRIERDREIGVGQIPDKL